MLPILPHQERWRDEFITLGRLLRGSLGSLALRIDHIGSTAVPGLAAKDIIDIQVSVANLDSDVQEALIRAGFIHVIGINRDHRPPGSVGPDVDWVKWLFKPPDWQRKANIHVRAAGSI